MIGIGIWEYVIGIGIWEYVIGIGIGISDWYWNGNM